MNQMEERPKAGRVVSGIFIFLVGVIALPSTTYAIYGKALAEKVVTQMAMPLTAFWLLLILGFAVSWGMRRRGTQGVFLFLAIGLWLVSSPFVVSQWSKAIESEVTSWDFKKDEPLDVLVVLGGGTTRDPFGRSQFGSSGDRVGWGAQLYLTGKTKKLVTTGTSLPGVDNGDGPYQQTTEIWERLKIRGEDIEVLEGHNTFEEMKSLHSRRDLWEGKRVGLLTSAFHLPRAMRLARTAGLDLIPVAADYRETTRVRTILFYLPNPHAMAGLEMILREKLAAFVGR